MKEEFLALNKNISSIATTTKTIIISVCLAVPLAVMIDVYKNYIIISGTISKIASKNKLMIRSPVNKHFILLQIFRQ